MDCDLQGSKGVLEAVDGGKEIPYVCIVCDVDRLRGFGRAIGGREGTLRVASVQGKVVVSPLVSGLMKKSA